MTDTGELDRIVSQAKDNPEVAMALIAYELKEQSKKIDSLGAAINEDNKRYATQPDHEEVKKRVTRLENGALALLVFVFLAVLGALIALVVKGTPS